MEIVTNDLWLGAFVMSKGCELKRIVKENGSTVVFHFYDPVSRDLEGEFVTGKAVANVMSLKSSMNHIKDVMFSALRKY